MYPEPARQSISIHSSPVLQKNKGRKALRPFYKKILLSFVWPAKNSPGIKGSQDCFLEV
jgi:hypothetical protein